MSLLVNGIPDHVYIGQLRYQIETDYRAGVKAELLMSDKELTEEEKVALIIAIYYGEQYIIDLREAFEKIIWFWSCGKHQPEIDEDEKTPPPSKSKKEIYSFSEDDKLIYAAFKEVYDIDLIDENLHWWKFRAMLESLPKTCKFVEVMGYRAIEITSSMAKAEQKYYREMKKIYALEDTRTTEEKERDFVNALW